MARHHPRTTDLRHALLAGALALALVGCGGDDTDDAAADRTDPTSTDSSTDTSAEGAAGGPAGEFPTAVTELEHGGTVHGVYLAVDAAKEPTPATWAAVAQAEEVGYDANRGFVTSCDQGAAEAVGFDPDAEFYAVYLWFATAEDAESFVELYPHEVVGSGEVQTYCLD